jgi:hypothetical protein
MPFGTVQLLIATFDGIMIRLVLQFEYSLERIVRLWIYNITLSGSATGIIKMNFYKCYKI